MKSLLALVACLLAGCASNHPMKILTALDSGHEISVKVGEVLMVELPSNPTTGYSWANRSAAESVVEQVGTTEYMRNSPDGLVGVGGMEIWRFRATKPGRQNLLLGYVRPWEKNVAPVKTVSFILVVGR
jgi:inhibitor of cysteine peptidase